MKLVLINGLLMICFVTVFSASGVTMSSELIPWVSHLQSFDPLHIFPLFVMLTSFLSNLMPNGTEIIDIAFKQKMALSLVISACSLLFLWKSPIALSLYWISSNLYTIVEKFCFKKWFSKKTQVD